MKMRWRWTKKLSQLFSVRTRQLREREPQLREAGALMYRIAILK